MTTTRSTQSDELDGFEGALLTELRGVIADRRPARRRTRVLTLGGVTASAAAVVGVGLAVGGSSAAFAVHQGGNGDVLVTINRLDDSSGLERALAAQGVTAEVDYAHPIRMKTLDRGRLDVIPHSYDRSSLLLSKAGGKGGVLVQRGAAEGKDLKCHFGKGGYITLDSKDGSYVVTIPREAAHTDTPLHITTTATAEHLASLVISTQNDQCFQIASAR